MISYKKGYKYQIFRTIEAETGIIPPQHIETDYASLSITGVLRLNKGFASDGPSGPTFDTPSFMAGAFGHDALYEMMRLGKLPASYREQVDRFLIIVCLQNGMWKLRSKWVYKGVRIGSGPASKPVNQRKVYTAPAQGWHEVTT